MAAVRAIVSPEALLLFVLVAAAGSAAVSFLVNRKWGYTPERERELSNQPEFVVKKRRHRKKGDG